MEAQITQLDLDHQLELLKTIKSFVPDEREALVILQEVNKDARMAQIRKEREHEDGEAATNTQKNFLNRLGVEIPEKLTKEEASALIDEELAKEAR